MQRIDRRRRSAVKRNAAIWPQSILEEPIKTEAVSVVGSNFAELDFDGHLRRRRVQHLDRLLDVEFLVQRLSPPISHSALIALCLLANFLKQGKVMLRNGALRIKPERLFPIVFRLGQVARPVKQSASQYQGSRVVLRQWTLFD